MSKKKKGKAGKNRRDPRKEPVKKEETDPTTTAQSSQAPTPAAQDKTVERKRAYSTDPTAIATVGGHRGTSNPEESAELKKALTFPRIEPWITNLSRPWSEWHLMPVGKQHGVGLNNRGNDCFLNSVLQTVVHTPQLAKMVIDPKTKDTRVCTKTDHCFHCALRQHILLAVRDAKVSFVAQHIRSQLPRIFPRHISGRQEDAHEMLALLLDALDLPLPKAKEGGKKEMLPEPTELPSTPIQQILGGTLRNKVTCSECGHEHVSYEHIQEMGVTLPSNSQKGCTIDRLVRDFFAGETISSFKCDKCGRKTDVRREATLLRCPSVLIIYLKRFMPNANGRGWCKNSIEVTPQLELSLDPYTWSPSGEGGSERGKSTTAAHYKLNGVIQHWGGGMHSGHYTCVQRGFDGESWFHFNDSMVSPSNEQRVKNTEPYILVYVKKMPDVVEMKAASRPASI